MMRNSNFGGIKDRIDRLDDAFLFALAIPSLLISFIQTYIGGIQGFIETSPILIIGVACPFYIGYVKGAIENNVIERVRGWVYLLVGILFYFSLFITTLTFTLSDYSFVIYFSLVILTFFIIERFYKWLDRVFNIFNTNIQNDFVYYWSAFSAISLAFASRIAVILVSHVLRQIVSYESIITNGFAIVGGVSLFLIFGKMSHDIAVVKLNIDDTQIVLRRQKFSVLKIGIYMLDAFSIFALYKRRGKWFIFSFLILSIIGSFCTTPTAKIYSPIIGYSSLVLSMTLIILGTYLFMKIHTIAFAEFRFTEISKRKNPIIY